ncbi:MAG: holo-[acyl-carrier-protein] synthase [Solirubrobacteraceae bacterium]
MIGIDLLEIDRLERALERTPRLAQRLFTDGELAYAGSQASAARHLAARFCAKEAAVKALGLDVLRPQEIEVIGGGSGAHLVLHGRTREQAGDVMITVSLTHSRDTAAAVAIVH